MNGFRLVPNHKRFLDWKLLTPEAQRAACATAIAQAMRIEPRLRAFVEFAGPQETSSRIGSLAHIPYAAKDLFFTCDHRPRNGLAGEIESLFDQPAETLKLFDDAGATCIGFTAMTELAYEPSGYNAVCDYPRNPWNCDFIPGGSSSGSGVAVASGVAVIAIASDTGGSIRIPANCCGVTGWKPSWGAVSTAGAVPLAPFLDCIGLLARSAEDLTHAADVLLCKPDTHRVIEKVVVLADTLRDAETAVHRACQDGVDVIQSLPVEVSRIDGLPAIGTIDEHALVIMQGEAARTHASRIDHPATHPILRKRLTKGLTIDDTTLAASRPMRPRLVDDFEDKILGAAHAAILPVMPICTPPNVDVDPASASFSGRRLYDLSRYCRFVNMLGLPAVAVPVGFDDRGLPVALQLIGRRGRDRELIALAIRMQQKTDWHSRVPGAIDDLVEIGTSLCA
jgi:aspartyl-tRNA(Asn)/glutamyl-tRNA(Gln) amidotransferase subunit A